MNVSSNRSTQFAHESGETCATMSSSRCFGASRDGRTMPTLRSHDEELVWAASAIGGRGRRSAKRRSVRKRCYLWQLPSNVWQYSPAWQKCQMRECVAWHSHVLTVTNPSPQRANRLNLTAANASCANRQLNAKTRTMYRFFTCTPNLFPCRGTTQTKQRRPPLLVFSGIRRGSAARPARDLAETAAEGLARWFGF